MFTYAQVEHALAQGGERPITRLLTEQGQTIDAVRQADFALAALLVRVELRYAYSTMDREYRQHRQYDNHYQLALDDLRTYLDHKGNAADAPNQIG